MSDRTTTQTPPARRGLGRGLDSLIPAAAGARAAAVSSTPAPGETIERIPLDLIDPNPYQTRSQIDPAAMHELAESIAANGVLQPIVVRKSIAEGRYLVVAGERRCRASRRAGQATVPAIVRTLSDEQAMELTIVENLQRQDLGPMEQARAFQRLSNEFGLTQEQMSQRTGTERSTIANYMRLLRLPEILQKGIEAGQLTFGHAKALLGAPSMDVALKVGLRVMEEGLNVRQTEELVGLMPTPRPAEPPKAPAKPDPNVRQAERELERALGCRVKIRDRRGKGKITIEYKSLEDFDRVLAALGAGS